jgi:hypothetical protein
MAKRVLVKDLEAEIDTLEMLTENQQDEIVNLKIDKTALIKKNEALEAVLDTIAMATAAGQMVAEL